jgi:hypothetical protein
MVDRLTLSGHDRRSRRVIHHPAAGGSWDRGCMSEGISEGASPGVRLTVELFLDEQENGRVARRHVGRR